jgi:hypothetical protein
MAEVQPTVSRIDERAVIGQACVALPIGVCVIAHLWFGAHERLHLLAAGL